MGKFSDPNYKLLKDYFDILVAVRTGTDKSYLIGPGKTVVSDGGVYSILYEDNPERGYVGHRFNIKEIDGNRFKMTYEGLESTFSLASSAFDIGNEMYFRKDSFFHYWLARPNQDNSYRDYANQERTFLFFGKIWPVSNEENTYSIEFEGLKDFTLKGIPSHNQTINMTEWLKVYWDQIHHEMYNMTKTFWSMNDAREIDIRWLAYIAGTYGIEISEEVLGELSLREWVENLPYFLKRIGTYNALYIIWKVFLANTSNHLNVYERWGEWCTQTLDKSIGNIIDEFEDHHFLEFYGTQPSGGSGEYYYSQYNPVNYPTHTLEAPNRECGTFSWYTGLGENYLLFNYSDLNCSVGDIRQDIINITEYDPTRLTTQAMFLSAGDPYDGDFTHSIGVEMSSIITPPSNLTIWALSNELGQLSDHTGNFLSVSFEVSGGSRYFKIVERDSGVHNSVSTSGSYVYDTPYYLVIDRTGMNLNIMVYSRERRFTEDLIETLTLPLTAIRTYTFLYVLNARRITGHNKLSGKIYKFSLDNTYTQTPALSGNPVITSHYKVQIDLSTEPLGDIFDNDTIISEGVIKELVKNWEYVRPVSKYSHYEELIAPVSRIDRIGESYPLYDINSNGFMNTFFTGSRFISAGGAGHGFEDTYTHFQQFASKTWTINHNLNSPYILVQPWIFTGDTAAGANIVQPNTIEMLNRNSVQLTFNESVRGVAAIAGSGDSGVTYIETAYEDSPSDTWNINHNLSTNTPSGYSTSANPGPVVMHWTKPVSGSKFIPNQNDILALNSDTMQTSWNTPVSGGSIVRRSDYFHLQQDPENIWTVNHKLNSWVIVQCYGIAQTGGEDILYKEISPDKIELINEDKLKIYWAENTNVRGYAHVIQVIRDRVVYSPYDCDELGIGICPEVLGYWKIGTGSDTLWNPFVEGDLQSPVTSGTYLSVEGDTNHVYIDFIVPSEFEDVGILEVGLFNYLDQLVLYSRCSELFKPEGVQCYFHYRVGRLESSSSSSSSSSVSSSSSSSSSSSL